ncbi:MAG TPA: PilZ domain-containing protein [Rhizomicrobium sp.]|jgi:hypothetical protein
MAQNAQYSQPIAPVEHREHERVVTALAGKLFVPAEELNIDCRIINMSLGGAGIACEEPPPLHTYVLLYVEGFGRFEGVATRFMHGELGLKFLCTQSRRARLKRDITDFVRDGVTGVTRLRVHPRVHSTTSTQFTRPNGDKPACDVIDISLQGASLRTETRPPLGELVSLGRTFGRVVRHTDEGFAMRFVEISGMDHGG